MKRLLLLTGLLLCALPLFAQLQQGAVELSPKLGYAWIGSVPVENDWGANVSVGYMITPNWEIEGELDYVISHLDNSFEAWDYLYWKYDPGDPNIHENKNFPLSSFRISGLYNFMPDGPFVPFVKFGYGDTLEDRGSLLDPIIFNGSPAINLGGGVRYFFNKSVALRGEILWSHIFSSKAFKNSIDRKSYNTTEALFGVSFLFGGAPPVDSDGDGVIDRKDKCPGTPSGCKVDEKGCPIDSDGDGVCDGLDRCPDTPKGTEVDTNGCPKEAPVPAPKVEEKVVIFTKVIGFKTNKWYLPKGGAALLDDAVSQLKAHPDFKAEVRGYTDSTDGSKWNATLSNRRASTVSAYLLKKGIAKDRLIISGHGPGDPIGDNKTKDGRAQNRRVEIEGLK